jgi:hypothetical protein
VRLASVGLERMPWRIPAAMAFEKARELWARLLAQNANPPHAGSPRTEPGPGPFTAPGSCATCALNSQNRSAEEKESSACSSSNAVCRLRGFAIVAPDLTCCKNFTPLGSASASDTVLRGGVYSIRSERDRTCLPWVGLNAPHNDEGACLICERAVESGIAIDLLEGFVFACGPKHYYRWWNLFLEARLGFLIEAGEKAYKEMCDAISPMMAAARRGEALEAFRNAIATARDLEKEEEVALLEEHLRQIEAAFRKR